MARVEVSKHLYRFFPALAGRNLDVTARTAAEAVRAVDALVPGFADYIVNERGALRPHVNLFIGEEMIADRRTLSDPVPDGATVYVLQALSGG